MKRPHRSDDGHYHIDGKKYKELFGSRHQVWNGTAYKTSGNLTRKDLTMNKWNRIVSEKKHITAKKDKRLQKYGYYAKKGQFGYVKKTAKRRSNKKRGGALAFSEYSGPAAPAAPAAPAPAAAPSTGAADASAKQ
jgi:hypothetical protein